MAPINVTTSKQQITASVAEDKISANVSAGFGATGPQGPSGVITVTAPITNAGTTTAANVGISVGTGLAVSGGSLVLGTHTHDDRYYTETEVDSLLSGYATLVGGKVPSAQLPSYVDDVIEVATYGDLPSLGESGKIYLVLQTNKVYRWTGFVWIEIVASPGSTDSLAEGSVNLYYTNTRAAAAAPVQSVSGKTGAVVLDAGDIASGTLSASRLPLASSGTRGAVRIGSGISISSAGVISVSTNYAAASHTHAGSDVSYAPLGVATSAATVQLALEDIENAIETRVGSGQYASTNDFGIVKVGGGISVTDGVISVSTNYAAVSHAHGAITSDGKIGTTAGLVLKTGTAGAVEALAQGTAGQVLKVNSGATGVEWGSAAADVSIDTTAADILSASSGSITADDPGADRIVFWDDSAGKLTHLEVGTGLSLSGTTLSASGGGSTNVWIPASAFIPRTTNGCGVDSRETSSNRTNWDELLFDAGADEFAQAAIVMPSNYNAGTITARFYWTASGATDGSDDVIWGIQARAFANDDALDTAFGTAQTVTDTVIATNDMHVSSATSAVTAGGTPAANVPLLIQIYRDADAAGDTYAHDARLLGVEIIYTAA